jgi:hypothetical protein
MKSCQCSGCGRNHAPNLASCDQIQQTWGVETKLITNFNFNAQSKKLKEKKLKARKDYNFEIHNV